MSPTQLLGIALIAPLVSTLTTAWIFWIADSDDQAAMNGCWLLVTLFIIGFALLIGGK